jgi:hypothetical protein
MAGDILPVEREMMGLWERRTPSKVVVKLGKQSYINYYLREP